MSTRGSLIIVKDNKVKLACYLAHDSYPSGEGMEILSFLHEPSNIIQLGSRLDHYIGDAEDLDGDDYEDSESLLNMILVKDIHYYPYQNFIQDSLFCEWAYEINFDAQELVVYKGFQHKRWIRGIFPDDQGYYPCKPTGVIEFRDIVNNYNAVKTAMETIKENNDDE